MNFIKLMQRAKKGDNDAINKLLKMYDGYITNKAIIDGTYNEDLAQELRIIFYECIKKFSGKCDKKQ